MQFEMLKDYLNFAVQIIVWSMGWPVMWWNHTASWTSELKITQDSPVMYDFVQGMLLFLFLVGVSLAYRLPLNLIEKFLV